MTDLNGIQQIERDDPRFTAIAEATTFSGFTALAEADPERPSNRRILALSLIALFLGFFFAQAAFFGTYLLTDEYRARTEVQYRGSAWTETQNVAVQSRSLTSPVAEANGVPIKEFEENLDAGLVPGTQILRIDYIDSDRDLARAIVAQLANDYIDEISELPSIDARDLLESELAEINGELDEAQALLRDLAAEIDAQAEEADETAAPSQEPIIVGFDGQPVSTENAGIRVEQQATQQLISSLRVRKNDLEFRILDLDLRGLEKTANGSPEIVTDPFVFEDPVFPRPPLFAAVGFILGLAIGGLIMLLNWNHTAWSSIDALTRRLPGGSDEIRLDEK